MEAEPSGGGSRAERWIVRLSTLPVATWWIRNVASRLDPLLFRATHGRLTSFGPPAMPMLTLTATGRRSGAPRSVHLACVEHRGDPLVVASAMGQERHPAWSHNLEANPEVEVQARGERFRARAERLHDAEKAEVWPEVRRAIPQLAVYEQRTARNIRVFRLRRIDA
ncbi:MAG: nitroreductase family deazaflavin-dependent oxidoreductase [Myxococcota bacterium]|nr:nitroreductase family deazaflavin-dependent oxidoreductase [Myxococcota bacterium]